MSLALLLLGACSPSGNLARLDNYLDRLSRALGVEVPARSEPSIALPPRAEMLQVDVEKGTLGGLDFLRLKGCALQTTIARRNSNLGRFAPPSQRLLLELAFLREAPACIEMLRAGGDNELAVLLAENLLLKQQQLPALIFNATLGNVEYREFWRSRESLADYPGQTSSVVLDALEHVSSDVQRWLSGDYRADEAAFELALSDIARGDGGELLSALMAQADALASASSMAEQALAAGPLCRGGLQPSSAAIVRTVVRKFFIGELQPWSAALNQRYHQLLPPVLMLEEQLERALPESYRRWQHDRDSDLSIGQQAPREHVRVLQTLLGSCFAEFAAQPTET